MKTLTKATLTFLLGVVLLAAPEGSWAGQQEVTGPAVENPTAQDERWLENKIRHELIMLPYFSVFDDLSFQLDGAAVQLFGQVTSHVLKNSAARVVERIEGVSAVVNNIEVLPSSPGDDQIRLAVYRALYNQGSRLFPYSLGDYDSIGIIVKRGDVTLVGRVNSQSDRSFAYLRARAVPGVFSVTNKLVVRES